MFEQALAEPNASTAGIITRHEVGRPPGLVMNNAKARWLWGCLQDDFERDGLLDEALTSRSAACSSTCRRRHWECRVLPAPAHCIYTAARAPAGRPAFDGTQPHDHGASLSRALSRELRLSEGNLRPGRPWRTS